MKPPRHPLRTPAPKWGSADARPASALPGNLEEHTARAPKVHLVAVEAVGEQALRGPVPAGGDVFCVRLCGAHTPAGPKVP